MKQESCASAGRRVIRRFGGHPIEVVEGSDADRALLRRFPEGLIRDLAKNAYSMLPYTNGVWEYRRSLDSAPVFLKDSNRDGPIRD